ASAASRSTSMRPPLGAPFWTPMLHASGKKRSMLFWVTRSFCHSLRTGRFCPQGTGMTARPRLRYRRATLATVLSPRPPLFALRFLATVFRGISIILGDACPSPGRASPSLGSCLLLRLLRCHRLMPERDLGARCQPLLDVALEPAHTSRTELAGWREVTCSPVSG